LLLLYWIDFLVCLALYAYVCLADTRYREVKGCTAGDDFEPRRCEECLSCITKARVKHCQACGKCTEEFDHHCRYLNVCIGGKTYAAWFTFVVGLLSLMVACGCSASLALADGAERYPLGEWSSTIFYAAVGLQAAVSAVACIFLLCLLAQHVYFIYEGITTLEYIKNQDLPFPSLPPKGWRESIQSGECWNCGDELEVIEVDDPTEVWFCSVCQADLGKAGVEFLTCDQCDNRVNVCPVCSRTALRPDSTVITYRVTSLRRRCQTETVMTSQVGCSLGSMKRSTSQISRTNSFSTHRSKNNINAMVATLEGHSGDPKVRRGFCSTDRRDEEAEDDDSGSSGDNSDDSLCKDYSDGAEDGL
jgi:hypothetical protein